MATRLTDYIRVYREALPEVMCQHLMNLIQGSWYKEVVNNNGRPNFTQLNVNVYHPEIVSSLVGHTKRALTRYAEDLPDYKEWCPLPRGLEEFRVKCYNGGTDDRFDTHVDVGDLTSCKRYLSLLFYLNEEFTGGETTFGDRRVVLPRTGNVLIFPPMWMFPHQGHRVIDGTKYIMSTYLNYT